MEKMDITIKLYYFMKHHIGRQAVGKALNSRDRLINYEKTVSHKN